MLRLERPSEVYVASYLDFIEEMRLLGEKIWDGFVPKPDESIATFIAHLLLAETHPENGLVPQTTYWAVEENTVVGRIALRHKLNDDLKVFGGNIGYEVLPRARGRGIAKEMLRLLLETQIAKSIGPILLTCSPDNIGSNKTILANGGILLRTGLAEKWQRMTNYYWIENAAPRE
jgi:predicted acetyltransferase